MLLAAAITSSRAFGAEPAQAFPALEPPFAGRLVGIDREWNLSFRAENKVRVLAASDLAYWGRHRDVEAGPQFVLADGGVVRADLLLLDEKQVVLGDATGLGRGLWDESTLPRVAVRGIMLQPPAGQGERDRLWKELSSSSASEDRLIFSAGESIAGTIISAPKLGRFTPADVVERGEAFELLRRGSAEPVVVPAAKVIAICFAAGAPARDASGRLAAWLGLTDGSLVRAAGLSTKGDIVTVALAAGGELKTTLTGRDDPEARFWDAIRYIEPASPRVAWLSDQEPVGFKHIPFVSVSRPFGVDANVLGSRLRCGGAVFRKGLGMPSASRLAYDVSGCRKFEAEIAIDDAAGLAGSVVFKVVLEAELGNWTTAYESPEVRGGDAPIPVSVDLKGAGRMALLVDFADRGDVCDYANWLQARLVK